MNISYTILRFACARGTRAARRRSGHRTFSQTHVRPPVSVDSIGRLHWVLDVSMNEDQARNRKGNSAACLAVVRRLALNIARMHPDKRSIRRKFTRAQRDDNFLLDMIRRIRKRA